MKKILLFIFIILVNLTLNAQIIISNDTSVCGNFTDVLQCNSANQSTMAVDDMHDIAVPIGFTFDFYGLPYDYLVVSGNGYVTFDTTQSNQYSPWNITVPIPNPGNMPENAIMAPWQDINSGVSGSIYYGTTGAAPNRKFTVTWCEIAMFSCTSDLHTSQIVLHEGSNKIEMFIKDKPLCITWNGGAAVQGLVDATSTNFDIVDDPTLLLPRNFPLPWTATNEGWEFLPNPNNTSYTINSIPYIPIVAGSSTWSDANGNVLGTGPSLAVNTSSTTVIYADITGSCALGVLTDSIVITVTGCFDISLSTVTASCLGNDASISCSPNISLTNPPWDFDLFDMNGVLLQNAPNVTNNSHTFSGLFPGTYVVRVTDIIGYSAQDTIVVSQINNPMTISSNFNNISCYNGNDGKISVLAQNGLPQYQFFINGTLNTNPYPYDSVFTNLSAGTYIVSVMDDNNCMERDTIEITAPIYPLQALAESKVVVCYGASDGIAIASAAGGTPGYSYEWFDNNFVSFSNNDTAFGLSAGSYYLEVTDVNGCDTFTTVSVIAPQTALSGSPQMYGVACKNDSTGMLVGDAQGSWAPYQYYWLDASFDTLRAPDPLGSFSFSRDTLANLSAGIYNLHVYDAQGCFVQYIMTVGEPATQLSIDSMAIIESIPCYGDNTGKAVLYASGGMPNYTYSWDNGEDSTIAVSLDAGYHAVSLIDDWGCEVIDSIYIPENPEIQSTISTIQNVSCYGNSDGIASISTTGGVPNYIYFWSTGHTGFSMPDTVSGLLHGSYYVTTRDAIGCEVIDSIYITQPEPLSMQASQLAWISCFGADDGLAYASAVGGTPPYTFVWDNNQVGDTVNTLTPGLHTVVVTDAKGCMASDTIFTHEPPELFVHIDDSQTILAYCVNVNTASLTSLASGGTPGYTYLWDDNSVSPQATATASALMPGIYTVTVTDSRGCTATDTRDIDTITNTMDAMISSVQNINGYGISCFGANDGWAMVQAWGAHAPYAYQWYGPNGFINSNDTIAQLYAGTYSVYVYDTNNCVVNRSVVIAEPGELIYTTLGSSDETCLGACDGTVTIDIIGGSAPYTGIATNNTTGAVIHSLMGINNDTLIPGICSGDYTITLTDVNGCSSSLLNGGVDQQAIGYSLSTVAHINPVTVVDVLCNGSATGVLDVLNPNTNPGYSYSWQALNNPGVTISTSLQATGLQAGGYVLFAHYTNPTNPNQPYPGCSATDTIFVNELDAISASATIEMVDCWDDQTGSISVIVQGGTSPYNLVWNPGGNTSPILNNIGAGTYTLSMTDINNCQQIEMFQITQPQAITFDVDQNGYVLSVQNLNGGTPGFTYKWYKQVPGPDTQVGSGTTYTVTQYGTYYVEVTDANACVEISENFLYAETYNCENGSCVDPGNNTGQYTSLAACQNACNPTDIGEQENNPLTIYPNPFTKETTLDFGKKVKQARINIVDVFGKLIETHQVLDTDKYIIYKSDKASGIYFVEIESDNESMFIKMIIE